MNVKAILDFAAAENGAVTVDWVVLTAVICGLGLAVTAVVFVGIEDVSGDINGSLMSMNADPLF
jgi:hypothetical protein